MIRPEVDEYVAVMKTKRTEAKQYVTARKVIRPEVDGYEVSRKTFRPEVIEYGVSRKMIRSERMIIYYIVYYLKVLGIFLYQKILTLPLLICVEFMKIIPFGMLRVIAQKLLFI